MGIIMSSFKSSIFILVVCASLLLCLTAVEARERQRGRNSRTRTRVSTSSTGGSGPMPSFPGFSGFPGFFGDSDDDSQEDKTSVSVSTGGSGPMPSFPSISNLFPGFFGGNEKKNKTRKGGFPNVFFGFNRGLISCRREGDNGEVLENSTCPGEYTCTEPSGGVEVSVAGTVNRIYFCNNPYQSPNMACKMENNKGEVILSRNCTGDKLCAGGPFNETNKKGESVTYYICVDEPTAQPTPDYQQAVLDGLCCGGLRSKTSVSVDGGSTRVTVTSSSGSGSRSNGRQNRNQGKSGKRRRQQRGGK